MPSTARSWRERIAATLDAQSAFIDGMVGGFRSELSAMAAAAQAKVIGQLYERLEIIGGKVTQTAANARVLRTVDELIRKAMKQAGSSLLAEEFASGFNGHLPYMAEILETISAQLQRPLIPKLTKTDISILEAQQVAAADGIESIVSAAAESAKRRAMLSINSAPFADAVEVLSTTFNRAVPEAVTLAETSSVMFARTATDRGFRQIEAGLKKGAVRYRYEGPKDKLTRPFCKKMLDGTGGKPLTREQIEKLDNGQLANPFITGGGFNCRHQWVIEEIRE